MAAHAALGMIKATPDGRRRLDVISPQVSRNRWRLAYAVTPSNGTTRSLTDIAGRAESGRVTPPASMSRPAGREGLRRYGAGRNFGVSHVKARNSGNASATPSGETGKGLGRGTGPDKKPAQTLCPQGLALEARVAFVMRGSRVRVTQAAPPFQSHSGPGRRARWAESRLRGRAPWAGRGGLHVRLDSRRTRQEITLGSLTPRAACGLSRSERGQTSGRGSVQDDATRSRGYCAPLARPHRVHPTFRLPRDGGTR